ncbi:MAG: PRC-barrel domain-containing protein [Bacteroidetes bacterium]|nr:PRC-barrel domain-containing protein [Bacteroidota bacterium]
MAREETVMHRLEELHGSGYEVVDGQPDIIGWDIKSRSGKKVGEVADMLFEPSTRKVRYLVADLNDNELGIEEDREVLIPIGIAELFTKSEHHILTRDDSDPAFSAYDPSSDGNVVYLPDVSAQQLDELPVYEKNHLSPHVEMAIRKILEPVNSNRRDDDDFYKHEYYNDDRFYRHRVK